MNRFAIEDSAFRILRIILDSGNREETNISCGPNFRGRSAPYVNVCCTTNCSTKGMLEGVTKGFRVLSDHEL